jgi:type IV pilus assembly protein PilY1
MIPLFLKKSLATSVCLTALLLVSGGTYAASSLSIATTPQGAAGTNVVKPNLLFILDDSGSMAQDYTPDSVNDSICQSNMASPGNTYACQLGDVLYNASKFNSQYYDPTILYSPPKDATGTAWSPASTSATKKDPFLSTSTINLTTGYTDLYWCTSSNDTPPSANCKQNTTFPAYGYSYPDGTYNVVKRITTGHPYYYTMTGIPIWCSNNSLTSCQAKRTSTFKYPNVSGSAATTGIPSTTTFLVKKAGTGTVTVSVNNSVVLTIPTTYTTTKTADRNALANVIVSAINNNGVYYASLVSADSSNNTSTTCNNSKCAVIQVQNLQNASTSTTNTALNGLSLSVTGDYANNSFSGLGNFSGGVDASAASNGVVITRTDIVPGTTTYPRTSKRTDCITTTGVCSYTEELQNFANWYSFYRTRIQMMKTAISRSYADITDAAPGNGFRIGFTTIDVGASASLFNSSDTCYTANKALRLPISDFNTTQKGTFYTNLFAVQTCSNTPLRGALSLAGRVYAGVSKLKSGSDPDPIQYSCQQNFTFLSTDGYWNTGLEDSSYGPLKIDGTSNVGDQDGTETKFMKDALAVGDTLADIAEYYYLNDLRPSMSNDVPTTTKDSNNKQHMVTFTMGLGVSGLVTYSPDYETGGSADYNAIGQGTKNWGNPISNSTDSRIDDLWHAAVNGRGIYFSAADPVQVSGSLDKALTEITKVTGAASAAATSNLEPVAGDNFAYAAKYETQTWVGDMEAKQIDLSTGALSTTPDWSVQVLLDTQSDRKIYGFDATVSGTDKKIVLRSNSTTTLPTAWASYFNPTLVPQCATLANCAGATSANLFSYLMGGADTTTNKSYRVRSHILGDIVSSQPVYAKQPSLNYSDAGYTTFKGVSRKSMVYVGANDGFMHAFDASNGHEDWAFMPSAVLPNMYKLADTSYAHQYYVDGVVTLGDVTTGGVWKTVLVGGLNSGGNSYYALDITDPTAPKALWEFTDAATMGYTFGNPVITKLPTTAVSGAGKWVVLLTSGYNNPGGVGVLYALDAYTGVEYFRIKTCTDQATASTCSGSSGSPSGLAKINTWVTDPMSNNTALFAYGGDLNGDLWRFDLATQTAFKVAAVAEPITVKPELASVAGNRAVYFGTGLYLQTADRSDSTKRTIYGIKDDPASTATLTNVKTSGKLVRQTLAVSSTNASLRTVPTPAAVDWATKSGWFTELLESGERVNVDPKIQLGTLVVVSNVPDAGSSNACTAGGHAWLNFLDIKTGSFIDNSQSNASSTASYRIGDLVAGVTVIRLPNEKTITITTTITAHHEINEAPIGSANIPAKRASWRELIVD